MGFCCWLVRYIAPWRFEGCAMYGRDPIAELATNAAFVVAFFMVVFWVFDLVG